MSAFRQQFMTPQHYKTILAHVDGEEEYWRNQTLQADSIAQERSLKGRRIQRANLMGIIVRYTGGEKIEDLPPLMNELISSYEKYQIALGEYEQDPDISPLPLDDYSYQFEECVQIISLCILLQQPRLLERFVRLFDRAGFAGQDTLYEDLLRPLLPNRHDVDEWFHDVYTPLIQAIYEKSESRRQGALITYCRGWYDSFEQAPWHDSHLDGDSGSYVGYWAFEAAAIAYLYGIDDSKVDHMIYPRDLVDYARQFKPTA